MKYFLVSHIGVQRGPSGQAKSQGRELHLPASGFCARFPGSPLSAVAVMGTCCGEHSVPQSDHARRESALGGHGPAPRRPPLPLGPVAEVRDSEDIER